MSNDIEVLNKYLRCLNELKVYERFVDQCEMVPVIVQNKDMYEIVSGNHTLENLSENRAQYLCKIINNNIGVKHSDAIYRNVVYAIGVILIAQYWYLSE